MRRAMTGFHSFNHLKTSIIIALFCAFALLAISACHRSPDARQITIAVNSGVEGDALKQAARDYAAQTGIKVQIAEFPYANLFEKELVDLNTGSGAYDLIMLDDPWFPRFASQNFLTDLAPFYQKKMLAGPDDDFVRASLALGRHPYESGQLYALPYVGNSQLFFYRKDLFEKHNLKKPETWQDVLNAARVIDDQEKTGSPAGGAVRGYVMRAAQGNSVVADFMPIFWAFGAEMFDADGKPAVNSLQGIEALKFMLELGKYAPAGYVNFGADEVSTHLLQGTAAMSINWPAWISAFNDPAKSRVIGKIEFAPMPAAKTQGRAEIGNWLIAIPRGSTRMDAAFDFLLWATAAEQMKKSALAGNPPTRKSLFADAELTAKFPAYPVQLKSLESSKPRPRTPLWNEIENAFGIFLSKANSGALTAEEAMNQANAEITKIIERGR
ncbi:MAG: ABC transporter substrate-binding protein [Acidobacteriota bacterium]